jgi:hypothetical protein
MAETPTARAFSKVRLHPGVHSGMCFAVVLANVKNLTDYNDV